MGEEQRTIKLPLTPKGTEEVVVLPGIAGMPFTLRLEPELYHEITVPWDGELEEKRKVKEAHEHMAQVIVAILSARVPAAVYSRIRELM